MKRVLGIAAFFLLFLISKAQDTTLTLRQSVETAIANNLQVKQSNLEMQTENVFLKQSKANMIPNLNGNFTNGINQGRSIDPFTNGYINQQVNYSNISLSTGVTLYSSNRLHNIMKQDQLGYAASKMELQQVKDNITLNVILAYLQILNNTDQLTQAQQQVEVTRNQVERTEILNKNGAIAPSTLYDLRGQLANDQLTIITTQNQLNEAKLSLAKLMNVAYNKDLQVEKLTADQFTIYESNPDQIYQTALQQLALVKGTALRRQSAEKGVKVARSLYAPTLGLNGNLLTNYSSAATKDILINTSDVSSGDYVTVGGNKVPVYTTQRDYNAEKINYFSQFNNNYSTSFSVGLTIPILNSFRAKYQVQLAKIALKNTEYIEESTNIKLKQNIDETFFNMTAAYERYQKLVQQVADYTESFRAAEVKFNAGASTQVDYLITKNKVDLANINLIIEKYDYLLRTKVLDYYQGKMLW
jgi:outer membrane protein